MSGTNDPAMGEIMRRMFRRRQPGEARPMFPMPAEIPPLMVLGQAVPPLAMVGAPPMPEAPVALPGAPPGPMPIPPSHPMPLPPAPQAPVNLSAGYGLLDQGEMMRVPFNAPQPPRAPARHPLAPADNGAEDLNALVLALLQGQGGQGATQDRLRAAMGMAPGGALGPGVG